MDPIKYTHLLFTDGSIQGGQGGRAAFAAYVVPLVPGDLRRCYWGTIPAPSTSNRAELLAVVTGLESLPDNSVVNVITDSRYAQRALQNHKAGDSHPDLREALALETRRAQKITCSWVRSHVGGTENGGHDNNEFVDRIAKIALWTPEILRTSPPDSIPFQEISIACESTPFFLPL